MRITLLILTLILIFITVISQKAGLRIISSPRLSITVNLTLFAIELFPSKNKTRRKSRRRSRTGFFKFFNHVRAGAKYLIRRSDVRVNALTVANAPENPLKYLSISPKIITASAFLSFLRANAVSFSCNGERVEFITSDPNAKAPNIDLYLSFPLVYLFISALIVAYYKIKSNAKMRKRKRIG